MMRHALTEIRRWFGGTDKPLRSLRYNDTYQWSDLPEDAQRDISDLEAAIGELRSLVTVAVVAFVALLIWG